MTTATPRARALAKELRASRNAAGLSMRQVGERIGWSESKMSRCERAKFTPDEADLAAMLAIIGIKGKDRDRLLKIARDIDQPAWWEFGLELSSQTTALIDAEQRGTHIVQLATQVVPGLLQVRNYSHSLLSSTGVPSNLIDNYVSVRQVRQGILSKDDAVEYVTYLDEAILARSVGGSQVMAEQLQHLVTSAEKLNITVHVVPFSAGAYTGSAGGFELISFIKDRPVVHLEQRNSGAFLDDPDDVRPFKKATDIIGESAMGAIDSVRLIRDYSDKYKRKDK